MPEEIHRAGEGARGPRGWHQRGYLPHFDASAVVQLVTYRLADSLPADVVRRLADEVDEEGDTRYRRRIESLLDSGRGCCLLGRPTAADIVVEHWKAKNRIDYLLHAWVVMPNHVHVLLEPRVGVSLSGIIQAWKSISGRRLKPMLDQPGRVWQADYWDRFIRDEAHYAAAKKYVEDNPVSAGLAREPGDWCWSSAREERARAPAVPGLQSR